MTTKAERPSDETGDDEDDDDDLDYRHGSQHILGYVYARKPTKFQVEYR